MSCNMADAALPRKRVAAPVCCTPPQARESAMPRRATEEGQWALRANKLHINPLPNNDYALPNNKVNSIIIV